MTAEDKVLKILSKNGKIKYDDLSPIAKATWGAFKRGYLKASEDYEAELKEANKLLDVLREDRDKLLAENLSLADKLKEARDHIKKLIEVIYAFGDWPDGVEEVVNNAYKSIEQDKEYCKCKIQNSTNRICNRCKKEVPIKYYKPEQDKEKDK